MLTEIQCVLKAFYFMEHMNYDRGKIADGLPLFCQISDKIICKGLHFVNILL